MFGRSHPCNGSEGVDRNGLPVPGTSAGLAALHVAVEPAERRLESQRWAKELEGTHIS